MKNRKRNRLKGYDYSRDNLYFVTICVQNMICCLGEIKTTARELSVQNPRDLIAGLIPKNSNPMESNSEEMDVNQSNQIMRLNGYGLIVQNQINWLEEQYPYVVVHNFVVMPNHIHAIIEIDHLRVKDLCVKIKSLSSLIGALKTTSSKLIHNVGFIEFAWKRSFHDHIIKQQKAYDNISKYIDTNPDKWHQDSFFSNV